MSEKKETEEKTKASSVASGRPKPNRLYRSSSNRVISGVCGGLGEYFGVDPVIVRIIWAVAVFFGGVGLLAYILAWVIIPENPAPGAPPPKRAESSNANLIWGSILLIVGFLFLFRELRWFDYSPFDHHYWHWGRRWLWDFRFDLLWPTILIFVGVIYLFNVLRKRNGDSTTVSAIQTKGEAMDKKLTRTVNDRMIAGVCGGLARYFNIDASLVRIGFALLTLAGGGLVGIIAYIVMMVVIPEETAAEGPAAPAAKPAPSKSQPAAKRTTRKPKTPPKKTE